MKKLVFLLLFPQLLFSQQREKMLIVSPALFLPQLNGYIIEKESDMIDCQLVITDSGESFQAIKQKIATAYSAFKADFLLLIGDFEHIPAYPLDEGLSDMQYGILSENAEPEMIVGRFSVENQVHLQTMIQRSLDYKNCSKTVLGIASKQRSELTQLTDFEQVGKMNALLENKGFHIKAELFEGVNEINPQEVINVLNQGVTWVNYAGYGSYQGWNTSGFSSQHIDSLSNSGELPIIFSAACLNGYFAQRECFAEKWLRTASNGNPTGARAVVMSSLLTDWDAVLIGMLQLCENVPASDNNCRLGTLYRQAYLHITNELQRKKEAQCWLLFGDPSMWIYPPAKTKIKEIPIPQSDFLYPNPVKNGELRIEYGSSACFGYAQQSTLTAQKRPLSEVEVEIYDVVGRLYTPLTPLKGGISPFEGGRGMSEKAPSLSERAGGEVIIDVSHLANGVYFLKIGEKVMKFVKE